MWRQRKISTRTKQGLKIYRSEVGAECIGCRVDTELLNFAVYMGH